MPDRGETASMDEAMRCYKCENTGEQVSINPCREKWQGMAHTIECKNPLCRNFEQRWIVQVRPDGTIPVNRGSKGAKSYPAMSTGIQSLARRGIEEVTGKRIDEEDTH